jgi:secondary thiamine-phosphate synthase enzyme
MIEEVVVNSRECAEVVDMTAEIQAIIGKSGVKNGICVVYVPHTTVGLLINEPESGFHSDLLRVLAQLVPEKGPYRHPDGNAHAHIKSSLLGTSKHFVIRDGRLILGTWQSIFLCEFDGPRSRKVVVKVLEG